MAAALGGGRATAAGVLDGEKEGDSHAKATGGVAGRAAVWLAQVAGFASGAGVRQRLVMLIRSQKGWTSTSPWLVGCVWEMESFGYWGLQMCESVLTLLLPAGLSLGMQI